MAKSLSRVAEKRGRRVDCYVKFDTGMGRIGFLPDDFTAVMARLRTLSGIRIAGIVSHLACADEEGAATGRQINAMNRLLTMTEASESCNSLANSAGTLYHHASHLQWVRPGIMLYGASPAHPRRDFRQDGLAPVVRWLTRIIQIRQVPKGTPLGYGHTHVTQRAARIAQIPVGYGDGYSRYLGNRGHVLIAGRKAPIVGRICMDLTAVDITHLPEVATGELVTLLGRDGSEFIGIEDMALWMETIPDEVICGLGKRLPRHYGVFS